MVELLIVGGADPNVRNCYDYTPLHLAVFMGYTEVVEVLLSRPETDLSIVDVEGLTALQLAKRKGRRDIIEMLGSHASPVPGDRAAGGTMEQSVCPPCKVNEATNKSTPCQIIKATNTSTPCQINKATNKSTPCQIIKATNTSTPCQIIKATNTSTPCQIIKATNISTLCQKCCSTTEHCPQCGMNVCTVDEFTKMEKLRGAATGLQVKEDRTGNTRIHEAVSQKNYEEVKSLLSSGGDVNSQNKEGDTLLYTAIENRCTAIAQLLINTPAIKINQQNKLNRAPLHIAAYLGNLDILTMLVDCGADMNVVDCDGDTPLHWACSGGGEIGAVKMLLSLSTVDVNVVNNNDNTPLHLACSEREIEAVKMLLSQSTIDVNVVNVDGETPLHRACRSGMEAIECVKILLEMSTIDVNVKNKCGDSALQLANDRDHSEIVELLSHVSPVPNEGNRAVGETVEQAVCHLCKVNKATNKSMDGFRSQKPNEKDLLEVAKQLGIKWYLVGIQLEVPSIELDKIEHDNPKSVVKQAFHMLRRWGEKCEPEECTIATLEEALKTEECFEALGCLDSEKN